MLVHCRHFKTQSAHTLCAETLARPQCAHGAAPNFAGRCAATSLGFTIGENACSPPFMRGCAGVLLSPFMRGCAVVPLSPFMRDLSRETAEVAACCLTHDAECTCAAGLFTDSGE
jgi:hypothetical protein